MVKITMDLFKIAVNGSGGIISVIAGRLKVQRLSVYDWVKKRPEAQEMIKQEQEAILDLAENRLQKMIQNNEMWAIKYLLSTKGKHRGFVENITNEINLLKQEINNGVNYKFEIIEPNDKAPNMATEQEAETGV